VLHQIAFPGIDEAWRARIVADRGNHYLVPVQQVNTPVLRRSLQQVEKEGLDHERRWLSSTQGLLDSVYGLLFGYH
jgi:hypothetical protein